VDEAIEDNPGANAPGTFPAARPLPKGNFALRGLPGGTLTISLFGLFGSSIQHLVLITPFGASSVLQPFRAASQSRLRSLAYR